jgi:phytanoyl-CoA hydroxylase
VLASEIKFDKGIADEPSPGLYRAVGVAEGIAGFDALRAEHVAYFREQGYLVIDDAFTSGQVHDALDGLMDLIDGKNPAFTGVQFEAAARELLPSLTPAQKQDYVRKLDRYAEYDARLRAMVLDPRVLDVVSRVMGQPAGLLWDQALLKPPHVGREKPWHQDNSMFDHASNARIIGTWLALDEATVENGCMHIIPASHRSGPVDHFDRRDFQICDSAVATDRILAVPLRPGGLLVFDGLLHHGTPANRSPKRRRALQCHYAPAAGLAAMDAEERKRAWSGDVKGKPC